MNVFSGVAGRIDHTALRIMERMWMADGSPDDPQVQQDQRADFALYGEGPLQDDPTPFFADPGPAQVEVLSRRRVRGGTRDRIQWTSGYRTWDPAFQDRWDRWAANGVVQAEWWRHPGTGHPTLICLHSWGTAFFAFQRNVFPVRRLFRKGWDILLPELPFHGSRTPAEAWFAGQLFPGNRPRRTNEAFGQAVWDTRALLAATRAAGRGPVGLIGMSLGGYVTAITASVEEDLDFAVPMIPMVSYADLVWHHGAGHPQRARAESRGVTLDKMRALYRVHSPLEHQPKMPRERRMIIAGLGDRVCPPDHVNALWEHWDRPRISWFTGGHITHFGVSRAWRDFEDFLDQVR